MTDKPAFPIIVMDNSGYLDLIDGENSLTTCSALALMKGFYKNFRAYDKSGTIWKVDDVESNYKINRLTKFLAHSFYNPSIKVTLLWKKKKEYGIEELKKDLKKQIVKDDDIITQFEEGDVIRNEIDGCNTFDEIVLTLNKYVFSVNEKELWKRQEE